MARRASKTRPGGPPALPRNGLYRNKIAPHRFTQGSFEPPGTCHAFIRGAASADGLALRCLARQCGAADDGELSGDAKARANHLLQVPVDIKAPRLTLSGCLIRPRPTENTGL